MMIRPRIKKTIAKLFCHFLSSPLFNVLKAEITATTKQIIPIITIF